MHCSEIFILIDRDTEMAKLLNSILHTVDFVKINTYTSTYFESIIHTSCIYLIMEMEIPFESKIIYSGLAKVGLATKGPRPRVHYP